MSVTAQFVLPRPPFSSGGTTYTAVCQALTGQGAQGAGGVFVPQSQITARVPAYFVTFQHDAGAVVQAPTFATGALVTGPLERVCFVTSNPGDNFGIIHGSAVRLAEAEVPPPPVLTVPMPIWASVGLAVVLVAVVAWRLRR